MTKSNIKKIWAEEIKDSRGNPTIEVWIATEGEKASFAVPSGASTGAHEAHELRDGDGSGVKSAIMAVGGEINSALMGMDVFDQKALDKKMIELDGTANKTRLGGNSLIGASLAVARVAALESGKELYEYLRGLANIRKSREVPNLFVNFSEGGKHAQNSTAFQEYHLIPKVMSVSESLRIVEQVMQEFRKLAEAEFGNHLKSGDEGGITLPTKDVTKPIMLLNQAVMNLGLQDKTDLGLDVAASSFYEDGLYNLGDRKIEKLELMEIYHSLLDEVDLHDIEDPYHEEDFESFSGMRDDHPSLLVIGDDLTTTSKERLKKAVAVGSVDALIIKPNQVGTLSETLETMKLARDHNLHCVVSHRSGETMDHFIADLAYAFGCYGLKAGDPARPERALKYNRLVEISEK